MAKPDEHETVSEEMKALTALYSLLCYAMREVTSLGAPCEAAEDAIGAAQAAIRARMSAAKASPAKTGEETQIVLH